MWFCTTSSTYLSAVKFPRIKMRSVLLFKEIPPQTISDPPPYATVCSKLGGRFRSPLRHHTLTQPSVPESKKLDSSENIIGVQYKSDISGQSFDIYFILSSVYFSSLTALAYVSFRSTVLTLSIYLVHYTIIFSKVQKN